MWRVAFSLWSDTRPLTVHLTDDARRVVAQIGTRRDSPPHRVSVCVTQRIDVDLAKKPQRSLPFWLFLSGDSGIITLFCLLPSLARWLPP